MKNVKKRIVHETDLGLYVWVTEDGKLVADEEYRPLSAPSVRGDVKTINALRDAAYAYLEDCGMEKNGQAVFMPGHRQVSDEEYAEQKARQEWGLVPDPYDVPAMTEELEYNKRFNLK